MFQTFFRDEKSCDQVSSILLVVLTVVLGIEIGNSGHHILKTIKLIVPKASGYLFVRVCIRLLL